MDLRDVRCDAEDWIDHVENRDQWRAYVRAEMKVWELFEVWDA